MIKDITYYFVSKGFKDFIAIEFHETVSQVSVIYNHNHETRALVFQAKHNNRFQEIINNLEKELTSL